MLGRSVCLSVPLSVLPPGAFCNVAPSRIPTVALDKATTSSYRLSIVTVMSVCAAVWPQFLMQSIFQPIRRISEMVGFPYSYSWVFFV